jgi:hypothetical protein
LGVRVGSLRPAIIAARIVHITGRRDASEVTVIRGR